MRPVNLIAPEDRRGDRAPLRAGPLSYVLVGGLLLALVGVYLYVSAANTAADRESELAGLEQQLASSEARAEALQSFTDFASLELSRTETVATLARSRFDWERVMRELSLVVPADITLNSLAGSVSSEAAAGAEGAGSAAGGGAEAIDAPTLTMAGCASDHESVARFVAALRDIDGVTRVGLGSSAANESAAAGGASTSTAASSDSAGGCADATSFDITVAFDGVQVDPTAGGIVPEAPTPKPGDSSGVAETQAEQERARQSVESADEKTRKAVDRFVPGA